MGVPTLSPDIKELIFSLMPVKSILRFSSVSIGMKKQFVSPHFIRAHLARNSHREGVIFLDSQKKILYMELKDNQPIDSPVRQIHIRSEGRQLQWIGFGGSCDGLILLTTIEEQYVINPLIMKFAKVSQVGSPDGDNIFGLGFDKKSKDYKILAISATRMVYIYSLKEKVWKTIGEFPFGSPNSFFHGIFVSGILHFLVEKTVIVGYDFEVEVFEKVRVPPIISNDLEKFVLLRISALKGRLCSVYEKLNSEIQVWTLNVY